jgi:DNA repair exonuclease SbcCD ATPase subunit
MTSKNIATLYDCMNVCEQWFPVQSFACFDQCIKSEESFDPSPDKQTISLLRDELQETIAELNAMMGRLERVTAELKEMTIDKEMYRNQIQSLTEENERLQERIKKLEGTFHSTDMMNITLPALIPRIPANT